MDFCNWKTWTIALSVLGLSLLDAMMTCSEILSGRVQEANPVMRYTINKGGIYVFFGVKAAMTALPLAILVLHNEWPLARTTARICLWSYVLITAYHCYLLFGIDI